jgi:hypothetical protein
MPEIQPRITRMIIWGAHPVPRPAAGSAKVASAGDMINDILTDANNALGGNGLPSYYAGSFNNLKDLINELNNAFPNYPKCAVGAFATSYLCPICP